jgi:hypothetical protein
VGGGKGEREKGKWIGIGELTAGKGIQGKFKKLLEGQDCPEGLGVCVEVEGW